MLLDKFFEFFRVLFGLSDEQVEKAQEELKNTKKSDSESEKSTESKEKEKEKDKPVEKVETITETEKKEKLKSVDDESQSADATSDTVKGGESMEEFKVLQEELKAMKALLEQTQAERATEKRATKIKSIKDCIDYDVLTSLLDGVEDKDIDTKIQEIQKEKAYLFKAKETEGFNPATPSSTLTGVEAAFFDLNPNLKGL